MNRNVFGAMIVAGGLALWTSVAGFADFTPATAKAAIATCASAVVLTDPTGLTPQAATEAAAVKAEATVGLAEITAEANSNVDEAVAESTDEGAAKDAAALNAQLTEIVADACKAFANLKAEYDAAIAELKAESTTPEVKQPEVDKQDVEKPEKPEVDKEKADKPEKPQVHSTTREGND
jgi:hypothetical protein